VLVTEAAPWPSIVQRAGRLQPDRQDRRRRNVVGTPAKHLHTGSDIEPAPAALEALEGRSVTGEQLLDQKVETTRVEVSVLAPPDLLALFDTSADLDGNDLDVAPYVRDSDDLDVQLAGPPGLPPTERPATGHGQGPEMPLRAGYH